MLQTLIDLWSVFVRESRRCLVRLLVLESADGVDAEHAARGAKRSKGGKRTATELQMTQIEQEMEGW